MHMRRYLVSILAVFAVALAATAATARADAVYVYGAGSGVVLDDQTAAQSVVAVPTSITYPSSDLWWEGPNPTGGIVFAGVRLQGAYNAGCTLGACGDEGMIQAGWIRSDGPISVPFGSTDCLYAQNGNMLAGMFVEWVGAGPGQAYHCRYVPTPGQMLWGQKAVFTVKNTGTRWVAHYHKIGNNGSPGQAVCLLANCTTGITGLGFSNGPGVLITEALQNTPAPCELGARFGAFDIPESKWTNQTLMGSVSFLTRPGAEGTPFYSIDQALATLFAQSPATTIDVQSQYWGTAPDYYANQYYSFIVRQTECSFWRSA